MMVTLGMDVGDMIQIRTTSLELAKLVKLQPQSTNFLEISDPKAVLERAFRNFATLTKGDVFNFEYNDTVYDVAVLDVKPETDKMGVSMIETDVSVDFAPPVGYVEPERQSGTSTPMSGPSGVPTEGVMQQEGPMAKAINYKALVAASEAEPTNFTGGGHRLGKKGGKSTTPKPDDATPASTPALRSSRRGGPMPLRMPPNSLFFGYPVKPLKTVEQKAKEAEDANKPHFPGMGQTLRGATKRKGDSDDKGKEPDKKGPGEGNRLDGQGRK